MKSKYTTFVPDLFGVHRKLVDSIPSGSLVLDVGCATGYLARELTKKDCQVVGIEKDKQSVRLAGRYLKRVIAGDVEDPKTLAKLDSTKFDTIILADILEHLRDPLCTLKEIKHYLTSEGRVYISTPNVAFLTIRLQLLLGRFDYAKYGIMDETHLRFFTKETLLALVAQSGLTPVTLVGIGNFTQLPLYMQTLYPIVGKKYWWRTLEQKMTSWWIEGLAYQFLVTCEYSS